MDIIGSYEEYWIYFFLYNFILSIVLFLVFDIR